MSLKDGQGYKLELHCDEVLHLERELQSLYELHSKHGVPKGRQSFVVAKGEFEHFLRLGQAELERFLNADAGSATETLLKFVRWLAQTPNAGDAANKLASVPPEQLNQLASLFGLGVLKDAVQVFRANKSNNDEEFWQKALNDRLYVLSHLFAYPVVITQSKAYVGGKRFDNSGGHIVDFFGKVESTSSIVLIEIKTPQTKLLGPKYRSGVYSVSGEVMDAVAQVLRYKQSVLKEFNSLRENEAVVGEPRCLVIAGSYEQLTNGEKKDCFELMRERIQGVTIVTFDELFRRLEKLVELIEGTSTNPGKSDMSCNAVEAVVEDDEVVCDFEF